MKPHTGVLALVDPDFGSQRVLERAVRLASAFDARLELLDVVYDQFVQHDDKAVESLVGHRRESALALADTAAEDLDDIDVDVHWGRGLAEEVIRKSTESDADIVVKATHHHSLLKRTLLSHADWDLIRSCPSDLLLVKDRDLPEEPTVLAAIDPVQDHAKPESLDYRILERAELLSDRLGGSLEPVHVLDTRGLAGSQLVTPRATVAPALPVLPPVLPPSADEIRRCKSEREALIDKVLNAAGIDHCTPHIRVGDAATDLPEMAEALDADLMVLGALSRSGLDRMLIGNTAERILDRLRCDVLVVKP